MLKTSFILLIVAIFRQSDAASEFSTPTFYPGRTGIVQMFQWPYASIARECEAFLGPKGFAAVQTSPVHENRIIPGRSWYEIYQPISYKIINRLGDQKAFSDMVTRCSRQGVRVIVDVVLNHMSDEGETLILKGKGGSLACPKNRLYPAVPYTKLDFHKPCNTTDWNNKTQMRVCELLTLPDLDQSKLNVRVQLSKMMNKLIDLGVAGFRIDASSFMEPEDLKAIFKRLTKLNTKFNFTSNTPPFIYHEAHTFKNDYIDLGRLIEFSYAFFLARGMRGIYPLKNFYNIGETWGLVKNEDAVVDNDNHDSQRSLDQLTYREPIQFRMATAFMIAYPYGIPKMISSFAYKNITEGPPMDLNENIIDPAPDANGDCQANWNCEHRYQGIGDMIGFANIVQGQEVKSFWGNDDGQMGFCRGDKGFIAFNSGTENMDVELDVCVPAGTYCDIATGQVRHDQCSWKKSCTGREIVVNDNHKARIQIAANDDQRFVAIHIKSLRR